MRFLGLCVLSASAILFISMLDAVNPQCEGDQGCVCINYPGAGQTHCVPKTKSSAAREGAGFLKVSQLIGPS
ncbi:hypothetical protein Bealeia1_00038 [Candidatus Bealeia paramacronuclearis]|uniref:Uncharacterized protein n=2 Tax=Candidatus Bealeia paramacronuclearis TaxID=1921001 RepID=A0ABZ2C0S5_9PROT|nr:hypothetical protein [Candidatus Bealeia paramacronuclearis]